MGSIIPQLIINQQWFWTLLAWLGRFVAMAAHVGSLTIPQGPASSALIDETRRLIGLLCVGGTLIPWTARWKPWLDSHRSSKRLKFKILLTNYHELMIFQSNLCVNRSAEALWNNNVSRFCNFKPSDHLLLVNLSCSACFRDNSSIATCRTRIMTWLIVDTRSSHLYDKTLKYKTQTHHLRLSKKWRHLRAVVKSAAPLTVTQPSLPSFLAWAKTEG